MFFKRQQKSYKYGRIRNGTIVLRDGESFDGFEGHLFRMRRVQDEIDGRVFYRYELYFSSPSDPAEVFVLSLTEDSRAAEDIVGKLATWVDFSEEFGRPGGATGYPLVRLTLRNRKKDGKVYTNYSLVVDGQYIRTRYVDKEVDSYEGLLSQVVMPPIQWVEAGRGRWIKANVTPRLEFVAQLAEKVELALKGITISMESGL